MMIEMLLATASAALECAVTATAAMPSLQNYREVELKIALQEETLFSMQNGATPPMPLRFADETEPARGWVIHTGQATDRPLMILGRVTQHAAGAQPFFVRWGIATRAADGRAWDWQETLRGPCRLSIREEPR